MSVVGTYRQSRQEQELAQARRSIVTRCGSMVNRTTARVFIRTDPNESSQALRRQGLRRRLDRQQHMCCQEHPHPWDTDEQGYRVAEIRVLIDQALDLGFQALDMG